MNGQSKGRSFHRRSNAVAPFVLNALEPLMLRTSQGLPARGLVAPGGAAVRLEVIGSWRVE
jgi:hypothetical protein